MKFYFKFQKLLEIERYREQDLIKELNTVRKKLHDEEKLLVFLQSVLVLQQSEMEKALHSQGEVKVFVLFESYFAKLNHDITIQSAKVKDAFKKAESVRNTLLNVFKKRNILEKLRERQERDYKKQALKSENKLFDEIATSRFHYKRKKNDVG